MFSIIGKGELETVRKAQHAQSLPEAAGIVRSKASEILASLPDGTPALVLKAGSGKVGVDVRGKALDASVVEGLRVGWQVDFSSIVTPGAIPTNKVIVQADNLRMPSGVVLIVGGASTAKTPLAHLLASAGDSPYGVVRYGEPLAMYAIDVAIAMSCLATAIVLCQDVVLDSVKDLLAFASGGAMASGLSRGALPILSDMASIATTVGTSLYVPINPSTDKEEVVAMVVEASRSNATTTIVADESVSGWSVYARRGEGLERELSRFDATFSAGSLLMHFKNAKQSTGLKSAAPGDFSNSARSVAGNMVNDEQFESLLRRHLTFTSN